MLDVIIKERLELVNLILTVFKEEFEGELPQRFRRGPFQGQVFSRLGLPRTGANMRAVNDAMKIAGYSMIIIDGWGLYKRMR